MALGVVEGQPEAVDELPVVLVQVFPSLIRWYLRKLLPVENGFVAAVCGT